MALVCSTMDRAKFSAVAHSLHDFMIPFDVRRFDRLAGAVSLAPGAHVLDVGCGKGEALFRLAAQFAVRGVGVEKSPYLAEAAERAAPLRDPNGSVALHIMDAAEFDAPADHYALSMCLGSTHAWGGLDESLRRLAQCTAPGGYVLIGEPFWSRPPDPAFLESLGAPADAHLDLRSTVARGLDYGLSSVMSLTSSQEEWDWYEGLVTLSIERYVASTADDGEHDAYLERARAMQSRYWNGGRDCLGFAVVLYRKPGPAAVR
ncbi:SAM-dependent methyltransferase [Methylocystis echinoides]|uniref:SAM-dependent methyltransferase n=1 Tax=Methylocystis echinoides TaxID=29468 RepID=A0A9W6GXC0_9HYPH|nr:class I SAM-dependent methyltransferase [Methylocystis echinoides]GLI94545.1 SAM-dependent methyltransferase [Methylocystis echinoides]